MTEAPNQALGHFCWPELHTVDLPAARAFYGALFGWAFEEVPTAMGNYILCQIGGLDVAGAYQAAASPGGSHWNNYVAVASSDASAAQAVDLGAQILAGPFDVSGIGRMVVVQDPCGAVLCHWEARGHTGIALSGQPGTLGWTELATAHPEASAAFYCDLFAWDPVLRTDLPTPYTELLRNGLPIAGIYPSQAEPGFWMPYFSVGDPKAGAEAALRLGGRVVVPATPLPTVGAFAICADPQGARFGLIRFDT